MSDDVEILTPGATVADEKVFGRCPRCGCSFRCRRKALRLMKDGNSLGSNCANYEWHAVLKCPNVQCGDWVVVGYEKPVPGRADADAPYFWPLLDQDQV